jgi:hypothetical protein
MLRYDMKKNDGKSLVLWQLIIIRHSSSLIKAFCASSASLHPHQAKKAANARHGDDGSLGLFSRELKSIPVRHVCPPERFLTFFVFLYPNSAS